MLGALLLFFAAGLSASVPEEGCDSIPALAYSIMFDSSDPKTRIVALVRLCLKEPDGFKCRLPSRDQVLGMLEASEFPLPVEKMQIIITSPKVEQIFKTSCHAYSSDLSLEKLKEFEEKPADSLRFISHHTVNGKFFTRFSYDMRTDWFKSDTWIMERKCILPGVKQVRGIFGYINHLSYFTVLVPVQNRTLRIVAVWCDAGGKLPIIGKIRAKYKDLIDGIKSSTKEIMEYFKRNKT